MKSNKKYLSSVATIEKRAEEENKMVVEGYAVVFDEPTDMGGFIEVIERGALDNADLKDVCMKYNHEDGYPALARTRNKSLQLTIDERGLKVRAELIDTQSNIDIFKMIQSRLLDKMSFAFIVEDAVWETIDGMDTRRIRGIGKLFDVAVVDFPAYEQTEIYARCKNQIDEEHEQYKKLKFEKEKMRLIIQSL